MPAPFTAGMTALVAVAVLIGSAVLGGAPLLPMRAGAARPGRGLRRAQVRRRDLPGSRAHERRAASLLESASARACASYAEPRSGDAPPTALSPRLVLARSSATVTSSASRYGSEPAARASASAPLRPDYAHRYQTALAGEARRRGLEVRECLAVASPAEGAAHPGVTAVVTTWLEVGLPGRRSLAPLSSTEVIIVRGDVRATITVLGLDVLSQGEILHRLVSSVSRRLPATTRSDSTTATTDWLFWPHGA